MTSGITVDPELNSENDTPVKKVTITDRDDAYLAALLRNDSGIDLDDIQFEGDDILGYTPPVPTSTREWLLLALAQKLNAHAQGVKPVGAPSGLQSNASLEAVISKVNAIISALIEAGVLSRDQNPVNQ